MKIAYGRCSKDEQNLDLQMDAFEKVGVDQVFFDEGISALSKDRPGLRKALKSLKRGDQFVIWKLDRAFRSLRHALDTLDDFEKRGIEFLDITEGIDTKTPFGRCIFQIRGAFAELELNLLKERTRAGMAAAAKRGVHCGRPRALLPCQIQDAKLRISKGAKIKHVAQLMQVHESTLHRALRH